MSKNEPSLAVLIDADNTSPDWAEPIFKELATIGEANVRRIYGDFSGTLLRRWASILADHALIPHQQPAYTKGKNSADIALVIDAMDLLHTGRFDGFVLVSSDSDFTRLASRIREQGLEVFGIGQKKTPSAFRNACKRFIFIENLLVTEAAAEDAATARADEGALKTHPPSKARPLIVDAMRKEDEEWVSLSVIGSHIRNEHPDFDSRTYGCAKLSDLVKKAGSFEVNSRNTPVLVRRKPGG